jgi:hypothetical protein
MGCCRKDEKTTLLSASRHLSQVAIYISHSGTPAARPAPNEYRQPIHAFRLSRIPREKENYAFWQDETKLEGEKVGEVDGVVYRERHGVNAFILKVRYAHEESRRRPGVEGSRALSYQSASWWSQPALLQTLFLHEDTTSVASIR